MSPRLHTVLLYVRAPDEVADFYAKHFGYQIRRLDGDRITELVPPDTEILTILLHPAAKGQKPGQSLVKLVFTVDDVMGFREAAAARGLDFGPLHQGDGYVFANARDPAGTPIQITARPRA